MPFAGGADAAATLEPGTRLPRLHPAGTAAGLFCMILLSG